MLQICIEGSIWIVELHRNGRRNAVDRTLAAELADAFRKFEEDPKALLAVLWGAGGNFSSGADLKEIASGNPNRISIEGDGPLGPTRMELSKPVIAAVEGYAVAGGLELALWCDLRVAAENAVFGVFCRRFGVPLIDGGTIRLPRLVGHGRAMDMILTGREVVAAEALQIGLVNRLVSPGSTRQAAIELGMEIIGHPQLCMRADRASMINQWGKSMKEALRDEFSGGLDVLEKESIPGARRFVSKDYPE
jgi:enoyl-CoA hydratase